MVSLGYAAHVSADVPIGRPSECWLFTSNAIHDITCLIER
jgi:hypothetical protein